MRILFMADVVPDPSAGAAGTELQTVRALRDLGHEVDHVWAADLGRRIAHGNLHLLLELPRAYERMAVRKLRETRYDVFHVNQPHGFRAARAVHRLSPSSIFIHRSHGIELNVEQTLERWRRELGGDDRAASRRLASRAIAALLARHSYAIAREADGHVVSNTIDARFLERQLDVPSEKIAVIPQAAPPEFLLTSAPPMTAERLRRVLYVGQFAFFKAPMIVAEAMKRLAGAYELTWVCAQQHHERVRALAGDAVRLEPWTTPEALRAIYDAHGVFLFPSFVEGFGKVFLEAMSRGMCVVASDAGGAHDAITHGTDGLLVPAGDAAALADSVRALDLPSATPMSVAARRTAEQYTWTRVARELAAFYEARVAERNR